MKSSSSSKRRRRSASTALQPARHADDQLATTDGAGDGGGVGDGQTTSRVRRITRPLHLAAEFALKLAFPVGAYSSLRALASANDISPQVVAETRKSVAAAVLNAQDNMIDSLMQGPCHMSTRRKPHVV